MGPTRNRDLLAAAVAAALLGYLAAALFYPGAFPPITVWTGVSLLGVAVAEAVWGFSVRSKVADNEIGTGPGRLHPIAVARTVMVAKASAWAGALVAGWWLGLLVYLLPRRGALRVAGEDTAGVLVATLCAAALAVAALWLQHCCKSPPPETPDSGDVAPE